MNAIGVVVVSELSQFPRQVGRVSEKHAVQVLATDRSDQALFEGMRDWSVRNRLDLVDFEHTQVGEPAVKTKQRVMIGAEAFRWAPTSDGAIEIRHTETPSMDVRSTPKPTTRRVNTSITTSTQ